MILIYMLNNRISKHLFKYSLPFDPTAESWLVLKVYYSALHKSADKNSKGRRAMMKFSESSGMSIVKHQCIANISSLTPRHSQSIRLRIA